MVELNEDDYDRLLQKLKDDFAVYREKTEITNIDENEDIGGCYFICSNEDIKDFHTSDKESSYIGCSITSDVDSEGVPYMLVPQISLISDYLDLEEKNNKKSWFLTREVYQKL